jgi:outer membrane protein OmpA-like peptidoglycan-associated protein/tetratricopeptide (TPR) repeat protein
MKRLLTIFLLLLSIHSLFAQKRAAKRIIKLANQEMNDFRYAYAIPLYKNFLQRGWTDSTVYFNLGLCYTKVNQYDSALKYYILADKLGVNTENIIAEMQATLGYYEEAKKGYTYSIKNGKTLLAESRLYGFSNIHNFIADSIDYEIFPIKANTPYNEFNPVPYKDGLVFESNRVASLKSKNKKRRKKFTSKEEFPWDGAGYTSLYFIPSTKNIRLDSIVMSNWTDKKLNYPINDLSRLSSNDNRKMNTFYAFKTPVYNDSTIQLFSNEFDAHLNLGSISFTKDGKMAYYTKNQVKSKGVYQLEIWESRLNDGKWGIGKKLFINNPNFSYFHPGITPDGKRLYYVSDEPGGIGGTDIYYIEKNEDGSWKPTQNAGREINTEANELFPTFYEGNLYFSSNGHPGLGGLDIYKIDKNKKGGILIKNMGYPINSAKDDIGFSVNGNSGFFSSNRYGSDDLFAFDYKKSFVKITGRILVDSNCIASKKLYLYQKDIAGNQILVDSSVLDANCNYQFTVRPNNEYTIVTYDEMGNKYESDLNSMGYVKTNDTYLKNATLINIPLPRKVMEELMAKEKALQMAEESAMAKTFKLSIDSLKALTKDYVELHHPFDQVYVVKDDLNNYYKIIERVKRMKGKKIVIVSAADCNGSFDYNENLSERRAKRIYATLAKLSSNNVVIRNVGERELIEACDKANNNKALQQVNRYSYVFILDK